MPVVMAMPASGRRRAAVPTVGTPVPWTGTKVGATATPNGMPKPAHAGASEPPWPRRPAGALVPVMLVIGAPSLLGLEPRPGGRERWGAARVEQDTRAPAETGSIELTASSSRGVDDAARALGQPLTAARTSSP